jgi:hypothetical protein
VITNPWNPQGSARNGASTAPDPICVLKERAEAGDFASVLQFFAGAQPGAYSLAEFDSLLRRAIDQASRQSPEQYADAAFRQTSAFVLYVLGRAQACATLSLLSADAEAQMRFGRLPEDLTTQMLPIVERLSRLVGKLNQSWASTTRLWSLAKRRTRPRRRKKEHRRHGAHAPEKNINGDLPDFGPLGTDGEVRLR